MTAVLNEVLAANACYAETFGDKAKLPLLPGRHFAILTCMDARLDPAKYAGLAEGDAHVIRNAGGRASDDAIRSLVISYKLLGTREWFVIHHTDCGMQLFDEAVIAGLLEQSLETATVDASGWHDVGQVLARPRVATSSGTASPISLTALCRTCAGCVRIRWCHAAFRSTATSTMCAAADWSKFPMQPRSDAPTDAARGARHRRACGLARHGSHGRHGSASFPAAGLPADPQLRRSCIFAGPICGRVTHDMTTVLDCTDYITTCLSPN